MNVVCPDKSGTTPLKLAARIGDAVKIGTITGALCSSQHPTGYVSAAHTMAIFQEFLESDSVEILKAFVQLGSSKFSPFCLEESQGHHPPPPPQLFL